MDINEKKEAESKKESRCGTMNACNSCLVADDDLCVTCEIADPPTLEEVERQEKQELQERERHERREARRSEFEEQTIERVFSAFKEVEPELLRGCDMWALNGILNRLKNDIFQIHDSVQDEIRDWQREGLLLALDAVTDDPRYSGAHFELCGMRYYVTEAKVVEDVPF